MQGRWASRKFWAAMVWQIVFTVLLVHGDVTPTIYTGLTQLTLGGYFVANLVSRKLQK